VTRALAVLTLTVLPLSAAAAKRVVVLKVDGLPAGLVERLAAEVDPTTGRSRLPWIDQVFIRDGTRLANFYVRGISLSAPSWQELETGHHQLIHGNAEYDRFTLRGYDYLNLLPFYTLSVTRRVDMPGPQVLDEAGVPMLLDRFPEDRRFQSFELYQRSHHWESLEHALPNRLRSHSPRQLFDEWATGPELASSLSEEVERELLAGLADQRILYLSLFTGDFDHIAHLTRDERTQRLEVQRVDSLVGRAWTAIQHSPYANETLLILISDHGMNSDPNTLSQGYSLVDWFGGKDGGGQHTITNRFPLSEYRIKGVAPLYNAVVTPAPAATYLKGQDQEYPTVALDLDGNERAAIQLRQNALNELQLAFAEKNEPEFLRVLDMHRDQWMRTAGELREELSALRRLIERTGSLTKDHDLETKRREAALIDWRQEEEHYGEYLRVMENLLSQKPKQLFSRRVIDVIPRRSFGERNQLYDLQNYTVSPGRRIDYLSALKSIGVRNNVQAGVGSHPVDFVAVPLPLPLPDGRGSVAPSEPRPSGSGHTQAILLYAGEENQVLILQRAGRAGAELRYLPVAHIRGSADGRFSYEPASMRAGLPLAYWEDPKLHADREQWFAEWHSEREWLQAVHETEYSNGIIGITEQFVQNPGLGRFYADVSPEDRPLLERLEQRRRRNVVPDLLVFSSDHWNFNARNFNPGGNHGSFRRISTHSVFMTAGPVPHGLAIEEPYDSLSFAPTVLSLLGLSADGLPGSVVKELFTSR